MTARDIVTLARDASSARSLDANGFLHVLDNPVTREQVAEYYGSEIPGWEQLGLTPDRIYRLYRPASELRAAAPSINRLPIYLRHQDVDAEHPHKPELIGGMGSDARFDGMYLRNSLCFTDADAIALISGRDMAELSLAYFYEPDMTPGEWRGQPYDGVMRRIRGNHLALVEEGRAGPRVAVRDAKPQPKRSKIMGFFNRRSKTARDADPASGMADPARVEAQEVEAARIAKAAGEASEEAGEEILSLHVKDPATGEYRDVTEDEDKDAAIRRIVDRVAATAELTPEQMEALASSLSDLAYAPATGDAGAGEACDAEDDPRDQLRTEAEKRAFADGVKYAERLLKQPGERDKLAREHESEGERRALRERGEDEDNTEQKADVAKAADAAGRRAMDRALTRLAAAYDARDAVRPVLGDLPGFNPARDSAEKLYALALDEMGVSRRGCDAASYRAMFRAALDAGHGKESGVERSIGRVAADAARADGPFASLGNIKLGY